MMHPAADIRTLLQPGKRVHLAGIGGVSMCALAEVLQGMGLVVQGSDMTDSDTCGPWAWRWPSATPPRI